MKSAVLIRVSISWGGKTGGRYCPNLATIEPTSPERRTASPFTPTSSRSAVQNTCQTISLEAPFEEASGCAPNGLQTSPSQANNSQPATLAISNRTVSARVNGFLGDDREARSMVTRQVSFVA